MVDASMGHAIRQIRRLFEEGTIAGLPDGQLLERFLTQADEAAFAALVRRHGPMVLGTCRAVLRDPNDVEDAFQATFLVLIYKARSIRVGDVLGTWLHRVAHRIAVQAGAQTSRRRVCERMAGEIRVVEDRRNDELGDDRRQIVREELARLSEKYRLPVLLCDLEGKTYAQAASELNCGEATVRRRLAAARDLLRSRLVRRGVTLSAGSLAVAFGRSVRAGVPAAWVAATVKGAGLMRSHAARIAVGEIVSTTAAALARKSLRAMLLSQLSAGIVAVVFLIVLVGLAWGVGTFEQAKGPTGEPVRRERPGKVVTSDSANVKADKPDDSNGTITYQGRVLDASGRPVVGAELYLVRRNMKTTGKPPVRAVSGSDSRFRFLVPKAEFDLSRENPYLVSRNPPWRSATLLAHAPGYAFGLTDDSDATKESTLRLVRDDVPISGRIIDLEGRPVVGATVKVISVRLPAHGLLGPGLKTLQVVNVGMPPKGPVDAWFQDLAGLTLDTWLKHVERQKELDTLEYPFLPNHIQGRPEAVVISDASTGPDGRFRIMGVGRERVAILEIQGASIETRRIRVRTRPGATTQVVGSQNRRIDEPITIYGASFEHVAGPTRPIEGVVCDRETGRPLAGVRIDSRPSRGDPSILSDVETTTDSQGRYRLVGLPLGREGDIRAFPPRDLENFGVPGGNVQLQVPPDQALHYFPERVPVGHRPGSAPIHLDINLRRGVWVTGRVLDKTTRKPVRGLVEYFVLENNPHAKEDLRSLDWMPRSWTREDGTFQLLAYPGPGVLAVARTAGDHYALAVGLDTLKDKRKDWYLHVYPHMMFPIAYHVIKAIDPAPDIASLSHDLLLEPADRTP
jgi:RNA polymerase sigma factor (sigma-70 family)